MIIRLPSLLVISGLSIFLSAAWGADPPDGDAAKPAGAASKAADRGQAMVGHVQVDRKQQDTEQHEQQAAEVERQAARADEAEDDRDAAHGPGHLAESRYESFGARHTHIPRLAEEHLARQPTIARLRT